MLRDISYALWPHQRPPEALNNSIPTSLSLVSTPLSLFFVSCLLFLVSFQLIAEKRFNHIPRSIQLQQRVHILEHEAFFGFGGLGKCADDGFGPGIATGAGIGPVAVFRGEIGACERESTRFGIQFQIIHNASAIGAGKRARPSCGCSDHIVRFGCRTFDFGLIAPHKQE